MGFSSWTFGNNVGNNVNFDVKADDVVMGNVSFKNLDLFTYYDKGVYKDGALTKEGDIFLQFRVLNADVLKEKYNTSSLIFSLKFVSTGFNLNQYIQETVNYGFFASGIGNTGEYADASKCTNTATGVKGSNYLEVSITDSVFGSYGSFAGVVFHYSFPTDETTFNTEIYANLKNDNVSFDLEMRIGQ